MKQLLIFHFLPYFQTALSDAVFSTLVKNELLRYLDPNDEVQELAVNVESIFYDLAFWKPSWLFRL